MAFGVVELEEFPGDGRSDGIPMRERARGESGSINSANL
jgi:hypothetical protein